MPTTGAAREPGVIVCGIDGSPGSRHAFDAAVRAAVRRGDRVHALWAFEPPDPVVPWTYGPPVAGSVPRRAELAERAAREMVDQALEELRFSLPQLPEVTVEAVPGDPPRCWSGCRAPPTSSSSAAAATEPGRGPRSGRRPRRSARSGCAASPGPRAR